MVMRLTGISGLRLPVPYGPNLGSVEKKNTSLFSCASNKVIVFTKPYKIYF